MQGNVPVPPSARPDVHENLRDAYYAEYAEKERRSLRFDKAGSPYTDPVVRLDSFFAGYRVLAITGDAAHELVGKLKAEGLANQTVQHSLNALKHMFNIAPREKKLPARERLRTSPRWTFRRRYRRAS